MSGRKKYFPPLSCWRLVFCLLHLLGEELLQKLAKKKKHLTVVCQSGVSDTTSDVFNYSRENRDGNHSALTFKNTGWPFTSLSLREMLREINRGALASSQIPSPNGIKLSIKLLLRKITFWPFLSNMVACPHHPPLRIKTNQTVPLAHFLPCNSGQETPHWPNSCPHCFKFLRSLNYKKYIS